MDSEYARLCTIPDDEVDEILISQPLVRINKVDDTSVCLKTLDLQTTVIPSMATLDERSSDETNALLSDNEDTGDATSLFAEHIDSTRDEAQNESVEIAQVSETINVEAHDEAQIEQLIANESSKTSEIEKGYVLKEREICLDLQDNLFPLHITSSKRREKDKLLSAEKFDTTKKKTSGFLTCRPVRWLLSFEEYEK